jgi:hypothetical protein
MSPSLFSINSPFINKFNLDEQKSREFALFLSEEEEEEEEEEAEEALTSKDGLTVLTMHENKCANKT